MAASRRRRLALVVPSLALGGGVPSVARFLKETALTSGQWDVQPVSLSIFSRDPDSVRFLSPSSWLSGPQTRPGVWEGLAFVHIGAVGAEIECLRYCPRRALTTAVRDCDVIQVVSGSPAWANTVLNIGPPVSLQVATRTKVERRRRDAELKGALGLWRRTMTEVSDRLDDRGLRRVDAVQVENPWMLDYARGLNWGRDADIRYAPPGVDIHVFTPMAERDLSGLKSIACVGRLDDPRKNIGLLLEAFALLPEELHSSTELLLSGFGEPGPAFWARVSRLGLRERVRYVPGPSREALVKLYQGASVFALPSDEEGLGIVLLEAMACGIPVVSTKSGGPDGIITDGHDGFLVPLDNARAMARRLSRLLSDQELNIRMGRRARATIEARYSEEVTGQAFLEVWDRLARKRRGG